MKKNLRARSKENTWNALRKEKVTAKETVTSHERTFWYFTQSANQHVTKLLFPPLKSLTRERESQEYFIFPGPRRGRDVIRSPLLRCDGHGHGDSEE